MTKLAFTADWHVDEYGQRVDPESGLNARLIDYLRTATWTALEARKEKAVALIVAGDLSERRHPSPWLVARMQEAVSHGPDRAIVTRGNHDSLKGGRWIGDVLARHDGWEAVDQPRVLPIEDGAVCAMGYLDKHWLRSQPGSEAVPDADIFRILADQFVATAAGLYVQAKKAGAKWCVLVCHQTLGGAAMSDSQRAFLGDQALVIDAGALSAIGFEAVVAGHLHRHQVVVPGNHPVLYTGSIERVDFGEELETKGFVIADVGPGRFEWEFVETPARRFVTLRDRCYIDLDEVRDAVVRCVDVAPELDPANLRKLLEESGAFEVQEIQIRRDESPVAAGGLSETLSAEQALDAYFAEHPNRERLVARGREILEAVR